MSTLSITASSIQIARTQQDPETAGVSAAASTTPPPAQSSAIDATGTTAASFLAALAQLNTVQGPYGADSTGAGSTDPTAAASSDQAVTHSHHHGGHHHASSAASETATDTTAPSPDANDAADPIVKALQAYADTTADPSH